MFLSKNFTLHEFTRSQTATRRGIDNTMTPVLIDNAKALCENVLQPIRYEFGPVLISSGYRSQELNTVIRGSRRSQHMKGEAADIEITGVSNKVLAEWIRDNLEFDQLILEFHDDDVFNSGWVHVSHTIQRRNRKKVMRAFKENGRTRYKFGLEL